MLALFCPRAFACGRFVCVCVWKFLFLCSTPYLSDTYLHIVTSQLKHHFIKETFAHLADLPGILAYCFCISLSLPFKVPFTVYTHLCVVT